MPHLELTAKDALFFEHHAPSTSTSCTFVFINPLTDNFQGQTDSPFAPDIALTPALIVDDLCRLMSELRPAWRSSRLNCDPLIRRARQKNGHHHPR